MDMQKEVAIYKTINSAKDYIYQERLKVPKGERAPTHLDIMEQALGLLQGEVDGGRKQIQSLSTHTHNLDGQIMSYRQVIDDLIYKLGD